MTLGTLSSTDDGPFAKNLSCFVARHIVQFCTVIYRVSDRYNGKATLLRTHRYSDKIARALPACTGEAAVCKSECFVLQSSHCVLRV